MGKRRLGRGLSEFSTRCCIFPRGLAGAACSAQSTERRSRKLENRKWKISRQAKAARGIGSRVALRLTGCAAADLKGRCRQKARVGRDCQALMSRPASGEARQGGDPPSYTGRPYPFAGRSETLPAKMSRFRKYGKVAVVAVALIAVSQAAVALLLKTGRMRGYLVAHLETSFGRPVQVGQFSMRILPIPELNAEGVTIGEDPAFGHEYFLRAERMTARFRWLGLLEGHFEFGTMSLTRPSLILVRTAEGRWNLERWLPPAKPSGAFAAAVAGPQLPSESTHHLQKIEFDDGRINFKQGDEKKAFAFTNVSGNVEQVSPGRWELRLEAQPWRSLLDVARNIRESERFLFVTLLEIDPPIVEFNLLQMVSRLRGQLRTGHRGSERPTRLCRGEPSLQIPPALRRPDQDQTGSRQRHRSEFEVALEQSQPAEPRGHTLGAQKIFVAKRRIFSDGHAFCVQLGNGQNPHGKLPDLDRPAEGSFQVSHQIPAHSTGFQKQCDGGLRDGEQRDHHHSDFSVFPEATHFSRECLRPTRKRVGAPCVAWWVATLSCLPLAGRDMSAWQSRPTRAFCRHRPFRSAAAQPVRRSATREPMPRAAFACRLIFHFRFSNFLLRRSVDCAEHAAPASPRGKMQQRVENSDNPLPKRRFPIVAAARFDRPVD